MHLPPPPPPDQMCRDINGEDLALGESNFQFVDGTGGSGPLCRVLTCQVCTVEPPNKGHFGATNLSLVERLSLSRR